METMWFWLTAAGMALAVAGVLVRSLFHARAEAGVAPDLQIYRDQLAEADRDLARGTLTEAEAQRLKTEISRRVLEADRQSQSSQPAASAGNGLLFGIACASVACAGALALYARLGVPSYPDLPLQTRIAMADNAMATRPAQAAFLASEGLTPTAEALAAAHTAAAEVTDPEGLRSLARDRIVAQDFVGAEVVQTRLLATLGEATPARDHTTMALILTLQAKGYVSPEAEVALRAALTKDPSDPLALYLLGEMLVQGQRYDLAFRFWRPLLEQGDQNAPWIKDIRSKIEDVAYLAGVSYTLPEAAPAGPTDADIAAAADMTPEERQAMIEGMVATLGDRLATEGGPAEDWAKLMNALAVLGREAEAQAIYDEALVRFAARPEDIRLLTETASAAGLAP
jgi:cytochrome c-type biogenesis protein CcmH